MTSTTTTPPEDPLPAPVFYSPHDRLSTTFAGRLLLSNIGSLGLGMTIGGALGSRAAALRFRAENAHRLPVTERGWYFYHKSKNYHTALGGIKQGVRTGARIAAWASLFVATEEAVDRLMGRRDAVGTVVAGLSLSGLFSVWNRLSYSMAITSAKRGLAFGLVFGLTQDLLRMRRRRSAWDAPETTMEKQASG
ncbi:uncharacterized protein H6S33_005367 [Morchella sextelata]|uniref:uncharacterized protein n=1 Tax=Morchella sextelata TaxID=1174677 RepID=UPI001D04D904|nr:uncharacterized protein H6S33_005367 [Morchella sextelata]KAH0613481.1 hypothetical protein H6S33_005367 [Morchella sextelata]